MREKEKCPFAAIFSDLLQINLIIDRYYKGIGNSLAECLVF